MCRNINARIIQIVKNACILLYIISYINIKPFYGHSTNINIKTNEYEKMILNDVFYVKLLIKQKRWSDNKEAYRKNFISKFALNTKKRHKEALALKKYRMTGTSTIARHYALAGRKGGKKKINKVTMLPHKEIVLPIRRCMVLGKMDNRKARKISKSGIKTHRIQRLNLVKKRIYFEKEDRFVKLKLSTRGLKTIKKFGLEYCCEKFKLNLKKKKVDGGRSSRKKKKTKETTDEIEKDLLKKQSIENQEKVSTIMQKLNTQNTAE